MAETAMHWFKALMGERLSSASFDCRADEAFIKCYGFPESFLVLIVGQMKRL